VESKKLRQLKCKTAMIVGVTLALGGAANSGIASAASDVITFHHVLDGSPLDVSAKPGEAFSEAVIKFHKTGQNPYNVDSEALGEGKDLYTSICQTCHMPDGSGRIGPSLVDRRHQYPQIASDIGLFEVVFGGAGGAMQPFSKRLSQDQILKVIAYVRTSFIRQ
jgi:cytochrome c-L